MSKSIVQFTQLGNFGRFGNQLFQYAFARAYAEKYGATLEIPYWIGERVFKGVSHRKPSCKLPGIGIDKIPWGKINVDLIGYFQTKECFDLLSKSKLRQWFSFQDKWLEMYPKKKDYVAAHIRKGDYFERFSNIYCVVNRNSYIRACKKYDIDIEKLIWISEENPTIDSRAENVSYKRMKNSMYGSGTYEDRGVSFLPDFFSMINAKILLRSNSSFGFWAGFLKGNNVYSPVVKNKVGYQDVEFVKGNSSAISNMTDDIVFGE